jgi:hypothetical protein
MAFATLKGGGEPMDDKTMPNRASNMEKAEGDRWSSDSDTVERRDQEENDMGGNSTRTGAGITNRSDAEESENQASLPERGDAKDGANAGHGHARKEK